MGKKWWCLVLAVCLMFSMTAVAFADGAAAEEAEVNGVTVPVFDAATVTQADIDAYLQQAEAENPDGVCSYAVDEQGRAVVACSPYLERSGSNVTLYFNFSSQTPVDMIHYDSCLVRGPLNHSNVYMNSSNNSVSMPASRSGQVYVATLYNVPSTTPTLNIETSGLMMHQAAGGWISFTNGSGDWLIH